MSDGDDILAKLKHIMALHGAKKIVISSHAAVTMPPEIKDTFDGFEIDMCEGDSNAACQCIPCRNECCCATAVGQTLCMCCAMAAEFQEDESELDDDEE